MQAIQLLSRGASKASRSLAFPKYRLFSAVVADDLDQLSKKPSTSSLALSAAAEALIEAASSETNQKQLIIRLDSLNESFDDKINTLNKHVTDLKSEMEEVKTLLEDDKKQKTLERASGMSDTYSFNYYNISGSEIESSNLAKQAIKWFQLDYGFVLPECTLERNYEEDKKEASIQAFRDQFKRQIKILIKREPRLHKKDNGDWAIFYK